MGASDLDYPVVGEQPLRIIRGDGDGMGLSTHVETSDRGSRKRGRARNEERIDEVDDESGRTSPQGTIGEVHEYMSENIESNVVHRLKNQKKGNQSVKGDKGEKTTVSNMARNGQKFERQDSSVTACSQIAVIREKIQLTNDNKHVQGFKSNYDRLFQEFQSNLFEEYKLMKEAYIIEYKNNY